MITDQSINRLLQKVQSAPNETLTAHSVCFENLFPNEPPDEKWIDISEEEAPQMRAAVRMGLITSSFIRWTPDFPDEYVPDGGEYRISLSGLGTERLLSINEPMHSKMANQILANLPTIIVSITVSLAGAWAIYFWGPTTSIGVIETSNTLNGAEN